jgi:uncharacterized protein (TIGR02246 family)
MSGEPGRDAADPSSEGASGLEWIEPGELAEPEDPVGDAIRAANARYARALATADADELCALFEPDAAIVDGGGRDTPGHDGLREMAAYARERYRDMTFEIDVDWVKPDPLVDGVAHASGSWRMTFVPVSGSRAGELIRAAGTFAETWHRGADGTWRLFRDLTLTNSPG